MSAVAYKIEDTHEESWGSWRRIPQDSSVVFLSQNPMPSMVSNIAIKDFGSISSDKQLVITVSVIDDNSTAVSETLKLYATGSSVQEAIKDFYDQVVYFYHYYNALSKDEVIGEAVELRELYRTHFHEKKAD